jgi:ferric-dicitrate binding protein FerR (iron transport regulator)
VTHDDTDRPIDERTPDEVARLIEAIRPTKEEDERAERFAMRLLETPATAEAMPASRIEGVAPESHSRRRDILIAALGAAVGLVVGVIVTLVVAGGA